MVHVVGTTPLAELDLHVRQGSDCEWAVIYSEKNAAGAIVPNTFTGWSARSQIRDRVGGPVWHTFAVQLTPADNKLRVGGSLPHSVTEAEAWNGRNFGAWDVELVRQDGTVIPLAAGKVFVTHDVTRV